MKNLLNRYLFCGCIWLSALSSTAQQSVLSKGDWIKIGITNSGVYKLDATFFKNLRIDLAAINPKNIKIYGNGGQMLPQSNTSPRAKDLLENAIWVEGETDGKFDEADAVYFYGQGPHISFYDKTTKRFKHETNVYSDSSFYFLTIDQSLGLRVKQAPKLLAQNTINSFDDYVFNEKDSKNMLAVFPFGGSGREWFGQEFNSVVQDYTLGFVLPNILPNANIIISTSLLAAAQNATNFDIKLNGQIIGNQPFGTIGLDKYEVRALRADNVFTTSLSTPTEELKIGLNYNRNGGNNNLAYLNFVGIQTKRVLKLGTDQLQFRALESQNNQANTFVVQGGDNNTRIWDISNLQTPIAPILTSNTTLDFVAMGDQLREFIAFNDKNCLKPVSAQTITNQDIKGQEVPNLLMVVAPKFLSEANRLAEHRRFYGGLKVLVVSTQAVFNEFSSGKTDVTAIRDAAKYFYDRDSKVFKYLLLIGDAKFDYKNKLAVVPENTLADYVPIYESRESLSPIYSYSSDDYFGFLENNEGEWIESLAGDHTLEIGIGRLPVKTIQEAKDMVDKLIKYDKFPELGNEWTRNIAFVADDGDYNIHIQDADYLAESLNSKYKDFYTQKIFIDAFPKTTVASGQRSPKINELITKAINNSLIVNYTGHGGTSGWAEEQILTLGNIQSWQNKYNFPLMVTATCEFGRYDDPNVVSGAELALLKPNSGAIGLLTTTRPVFANTNFLVNDAFYKAVFKPIDGQMPRLGDVMIETKNNSLSGRINRNFSLLGDPSMRLTYANRKIVLKKINGKPFANDTLRALQKITIECEMQDLNGQRDSTFSDLCEFILYDKETSTATLGSQSSPTQFKERKNILIKSSASIAAGGRFKASFIMPKDINYQYGKAKIYFNIGEYRILALGNAEIMLGGSDNNAPIDTTPPLLDVGVSSSGVFFAKEEVITTENPFLRASIFDLSGINTTSNSIGHELLLTLDDSLKFNLNDYFGPEKRDNMLQRGFVVYQLQNLKEGLHKGKFRAWDVYNNMAEKSFSFRVEASSKRLRVLAIPNPFNEQEQIHFRYDHTLSTDGLEITAEIFDSNGRTVRRYETDYLARSYFANENYGIVSWDGKNDSGSLVPKGIYFYRIFVNSSLENSKAIGTGKIGRF